MPDPNWSVRHRRITELCFALTLCVCLFAAFDRRDGWELFYPPVLLGLLLLAGASWLPRRARELTTAGALGGWIRPGWPFRAAPLPGPVSDAYGCGDCFAAGLTHGLAVGKSVDEAVALGAQCGAAVLTGRGAYGHQLSAADLSDDSP